MPRDALYQRAGFFYSKITIAQRGDVASHLGILPFNTDADEIFYDIESRLTLLFVVYNLI